VPYDLLLAGGHVIDPRNDVDGIRDLAIRGDRIAAVEHSIPTSSAKKVIDASGLYITPGLVDIHAHFYVHTDGPGTLIEWSPSVIPDHHLFHAGVTTAVDAGTSGWRTFPDFRRRIIDTSKVRVLAMINIVGAGIVNYELEQNPRDMDPEQTAEMARKHSDVVVGIKSAHWWAPDFTSVNRAIEAGRIAKLPVMVDFGYFLLERPYKTMVAMLLRPGDISTHFYRWPAPLLDENEKPLSYLLEARKRGVKFDVGHGTGSFYFRQAQPAMKAGFWPDSISTDIHSDSVNRSMIDMLNVMSKFLAMGMPLNEVIRRSTTNPATILNRPQLGQIAVGSEADVTVLRLDQGEYGFVDVLNGRIEGAQRLGCEMTIRAGEIVFDFNGRSGVAWRDADLQYPTR
jgi:dihydroorotase